MSCANYVVTAHKPSHVTHTCVGAFTSPNETNLVVGKGTRVEIHLLTPQGLQVRNNTKKETRRIRKTTKQRKQDQMEEIDT